MCINNINTITKISNLYIKKKKKEKKLFSDVEENHDELIVNHLELFVSQNI